MGGPSPLRQGAGSGVPGAKCGIVNTTRPGRKHDAGFAGGYRKGGQNETF